ncbi:integrase, catalytic region, zinc finger, CCHC-type containing protein [Tanacetum coccineum]
MATFTPQTQLTPEQVFWSLDLAKRKAEELKANATPLPVLPPATVYPPNTRPHLVLETTSNTSQVNIRSVFTEVRAMKAVFEILEAEVDQNETDLESGEIERKNLLITNENLVAECVSKDVFYTATDSVLNVSRFSDMHDAFTSAQKRHPSDAPSFDSLIVIGKLNEQIQSQGNTIRELKEKISRLTKKNSDTNPIFDLKALVSQNKDLTAKLNALYDLNECFREENAKDQLKENSKCVTIPDYKPKVLAPGRYPIDVEPIPPRLKKNREVHLHYIERLKENVETLREIVEDAKGVTFVEPHETSTHNTPPQVEHQKINSTNVPGIPSTGVKGASAASRSKPRSNTKKDRTLPAKSALKQVEAHSRMNKSNEKHKNHIDSSISYKHTVINSNSNTSCKTCNKCLISVNHDQCVVRSEMCVKQSSATKVWRVKHVKQVWKATGKLFTTIGHQWRPTGRLLPLGDQWPLTRNTPPNVLPTKQWKPTGRLLLLGRKCPLVRFTALKSNCLPADLQETIAPVVQYLLWYLDSGCSKHMTGDRSRLRNFVKKFIGTVRFGNDHFGAIMGYGDYVIGDSVNFQGILCEGLGHNLFSVGQSCDSDLEVAFRKHTCFVRDLKGVDLIKGSCGTNLYTIFVEDMMRSSPICLLSKASKNKSWLWHRRPNHLNFGTLNDLARKDLVRGLLRLQNGVVERRNRTLVEAARTMLIFSKAPLFLWAEAVATACYTQNRSLIHTLHNKTPYELVHDKKLDLSFLRIFGALCYPTNDSEDLGKLKAKADIGFGAVVSTGCLMNILMTPWVYQMPHVPAVPPSVIPTGPSVSISFDHDAPSGNHSPSSSAPQSSSVHHGVAAEHSFKVNPFAETEHEPFVNVFAPDPNSEASSSRILTITTTNQSTQPHEHLRKWTDSHPLDNIIGNPSRPVSTQK